ncbi:MAG: Rrf2 family transcriptional regulator, partial [Fibrobacteres bacterium]|nr:Rrf2 family transcriptional regulator [Fibrobacterota bacterium]
NIPPRFLEQIRSKLRVAGYIESRRGNRGGYVMSKDPNTVTVGQIIRTVEGHDDSNPFDTESVFKEVWDKAQKATNEVFDKNTFQTLFDSRNEWLKRLDFNI